MNVAVLTLCRDRLDYTKHCFATLRECAGIPYDHYIIDQGSTDGTADWLIDEFGCGFSGVILKPMNVGISRGMNELLDLIADCDYDVVCKLDNDCELLQENTLRDVCRLAVEGNALLSPRILGLNNPPPIIGEFEIADELIFELAQIGGIFLAAPAHVYQTFRFSDQLPVWGQDDAEICAWHRASGGRCGYVARFEANHYQTTNGQHATYPEYFARTLAEGKPAL